MSEPARWERLAAEFTAAANEFAQTQSLPQLTRLRALRLQAVAGLIELAGPIGSARAAALEKIFAACRQSNLRTFPRSPAEQERFTYCLERASRDAEGPGLAGLLLASHAFELQRAPRLAGLSPETRPLWLKLLLETPGAVEGIGDCERFVAYLRLLCDRLREYLSEVRPASEDVAHAVLNQPLISHAYFTELNLREVMRAKADIVERILEDSGSVLDQLRVMRPHRERPRIGFLTLHLTGSTDTVFLAAHLERLDRRRYDVRLYSTQKPDGMVGALCRASADKYVELPDNLPEAVAQLRREDLDIAVFCCNLTALPHPMMQISAHRIARMQVANGSSPVTTGLRNMDFLVQGEANETGESQAHYTERLLRIQGAADCYPFEYMIGSDPVLPAPRSALGVPEGAVIYFASANYYKLVPELTRLWIAILARVPNSYLLLMPFNPNWSSEYPWQPLVQRLLKQSQEAGVSPERVRVHRAVPKIIHLHALMAAADAYLDSFPYSGACSYFDALTVGLPVVARRGRVNRSRHGSAILEQEGLADWVADDEAGYVQRAVELGTNPHKRREDGERLARAKLAGLKLTDTADYAARLMPLFDDLLADWDRQVAALHDPDESELADTVTRLAERVTDRRASFCAADLLEQVVLPYLCHGSRRLVHLGPTHPAPNGRSGLEAFLLQGWQAVFFDSDPKVAELAKRHPGRLRMEEAVPVSLGDYLRRRGLLDVDFIHLGALERNFGSLLTLDFAVVTPRLLMAPFAEPGERNSVQQRLREAGYRSCIACGSLLAFRADDRDFLPSLADWLARLA